MRNGCRIWQSATARSPENLKINFLDTTCVALVCVWPQSVDWKLFKIGSEQTAFAAKSHSRAGQKVVYGR